jgi:hypothetical protein
MPQPAPSKIPCYPSGQPPTSHFPQSSSLLRPGLSFPLVSDYDLGTQRGQQEPDQEQGQGSQGPEALAGSINMKRDQR